VRIVRISHWLSILLLLALIPASGALASSWHGFHDKTLGVALQYPASWQLVKGEQPGARQVELSHMGSAPQQLTIAVFRIRPGHSMHQTLAKLLSYERKNGNVTYSNIHWLGTTLGNQPAMAGVRRVSTEGGVGNSYGVYVSAWKTHIYSVIVTAYRNPPPSTLSQFPAIYQRILKTWHFL
jgi:hypothetical protein